MSVVLRCPIELVGAGRTDAGVHAKCMFAHFDMEEKIDDTGLIVSKLNNMLPKDIVMHVLVPNQGHINIISPQRNQLFFQIIQPNTHLPWI